MVFNQKTPGLLDARGYSPGRWRDPQAPDIPGGTASVCAALSPVSRMGLWLPGYRPITVAQPRRNIHRLSPYNFATSPR